MWREEKGLTVFSMWSSEFPATEIDLFVDEPFPFDAAYASGVEVELGTTRVVVVSLEDLIALKRQVGRPVDLEDVAALEAILKETAPNE
jgi:predicted nucleotidyltransferase